MAQGHKRFWHFSRVGRTLGLLAVCILFIVHDHKFGAIAAGIIFAGYVIWELIEWFFVHEKHHFQAKHERKTVGNL
jgi:hypothetical protein